MIDIFKALSDENRVRIVNLLLRDELCVCEIEVILGMTQSNVSRHLSKLRTTGIIHSSKDAQWVHYKASSSFIKEHEMLFNYLIKNFNIKDPFSNDLLKYKKYKEHHLNCQMITDNKDEVIKILQSDL